MPDFKAYNSLWAMLGDKEIWKDPAKGLVVLVDEAQVIIGQDFAAEFFNALKGGKAAVSVQSPIISQFY